MLVMSLVVLGIFSFRELGVDLYPKADPATVSVALSLPGASPDEMSTSVVEPMEEAVNGVGEVSLNGGRRREIHIVVDIEKLNSFGLSMTQVRDAVVNENVEIPGGTVEQGKGQLLLRTLGRVDASQDFNDVVVATRNGTPIRVSDIGHAEDSFERPTSAVWMGSTPA